MMDVYQSQYKFSLSIHDFRLLVQRHSITLNYILKYSWIKFTPLHDDANRSGHEYLLPSARATRKK